MDKEKKGEEESCCTDKACGCGKGGCGRRCGGCGSHAILALVLLLLGGVIGYLMGSHCGRMGRYGMYACPITSMMQPAGK